MARLSTFIRENLDEILVEWEEFARTLPAAGEMDIVQLRDHAREMLIVVADDLDRPQSVGAQAKKARGETDTDQRDKTTAAHQHGAGRAESGFSIGHMVSEFRALRASVMHLWVRQRDSAEATELQDITRFNEAVDQAIAESITEFSREVGQTKDRFLAILSHDLRSPLGAVLMSSQFLLDTVELEAEPRVLVTRIASSARRMNQMVLDLVEFTRTRFGDKVPIIRAEMDAGAMVRQIADEVGASYPGRQVHVETSGDLNGNWDCERLTQAVTNLVANAVQHGARDSRITVTARGDGPEVEIAVHNHGRPIPRDQFGAIFQVMSQGDGESTRDRRHLGLGLYIVDKIVSAHGGSIDVDSSAERGTTFTVRLPRDSS